jgi:hypothetical protein
MKTKFLLLAMMVFALVACDKDEDEAYPKPVFLEIGNKWVYDLSVKSQNITMTGDFTYDVMTRLDDENYTVKATTELQGFPGSSELVNWEVDNVFNLGRDMNLVGVGDSWSEPLDGVDYYTTVMEDGVEVTVPAGTYTCRKLRQTQSDNTTLVGFYYYNTNTGIVLMEITFQEVEQGVNYTVEEEMKLRSVNF